MRPSRRSLPLLVICLAYLALATAYSVVNPVFEAPDETFHYAFVRHLVDQRDLPGREERTEESLIRQESSQPPLYYALGALLVAAIEVGEGPPFTYNPHASIGSYGKQGNANVVVHGDPAEAFPYRGHPLAVHLLRLLSVILGLGTVLATYSVARLVTPSAAFAATSAALVAFLPQFLFISGAVNNDNLVTFLAASGLLLCLRIAKLPTWRDAALLGVVIGLAALSKLSGLVLVPLALSAFALAARHARSWRPLLVYGLALASGALIAGWWYVRNYFTFGDPVGFGQHFRFSALRPAGFTLADLVAELPGLEDSFWGVFAWFNVRLDEPIYTFFHFVLFLVVAGLLGHLLRRPRTWRIDGDSLLLVVLHALMVTAALFRWTTITAGSQGRLLFPALPAYAALASLGLSFWTGRRLLWLGAPLAAALLGVALWALFTAIQPAYARPPQVTEAEVIAAARPRYAEFGGEIALRGYRLQAEHVQAGEEIEVTLYWRALAQPAKNYSIFVHVADDPLRRVPQFDSYPGRGSNPTKLWRPGEAYADTHPLRFAADVSPGTYKVFVGVYDVATFQRLHLPNGEPWIVLQEITVAAP